MKIYLAPLEGITGYTYRRALYQCFGGFDKYFIPFILPNQKGHLSTREKKDIMPENNEGMYAVPQILTKNAEDFIQTAETLQEYGYNEVNLNLGCPSKTVVTKGRGAGFLDRSDELDKFLDEIFSKCDMKISIKTRLGMDEPEEFEDLLAIYNKYPLEELILHPRVQQDYYKNRPDWTTFAYACRNSKNSLVYNGDIFCAENYQIFHQKFPETECIMLGRGILMNPFLPAVIKGKSAFDTKKIATFCDHLLDAYIEKSPEEKNAVVKMKELWWYLGKNFKNNEEYLTQIRKSQTIREYRMAVECLLKECEYD